MPLSDRSAGMTPNATIILKQIGVGTSEQTAIVRSGDASRCTAGLYHEYFALILKLRIFVNGSPYLAASESHGVLLDLIYGAVADPDRWPEVLTRVSDLLARLEGCWSTNAPAEACQNQNHYPWPARRRIYADIS